MGKSAMKNMKSRNSTKKEGHKENNQNQLSPKSPHKTRKNSKTIEIKNLPISERQLFNNAILRKKQKNLTALNTTRDNTLTSENSKRENYYEKFITVSDGDIKNKIKDESNEDKKMLNSILYDLFNYDEDKFKNNELINQNNSVNSQKTDRKIVNKKNKYYFDKFRKFIIKLQKNFKNEMDNQLNPKIINPNFLFDCYLFQKLENLLSRYSLIIFFLIQINKKEFARNIFLLMLKQNYSYIEYLENNIINWYSLSNKKINISKEIPKVTYNFLKIYSFIINYSKYFNMMNYCNIFICRYFEILHFIYNFFIAKSHIRGFTTDATDQIHFWFSLALHNASYYLLSNYFPLNISINLNNYIKNLYIYSDEENLTNNEKKIIIKTLYNLGLIYYLNGQNDRALSNLKQAKDLILNLDIDEDNDGIVIQPFKRRRETVYLGPRPFKNKQKSHSVATSICENTNINNNNLKIIKADTIIETYLKDKINMDDIQLLINYGINSGILEENYRKTSGQFHNIMPISPMNIFQKNKLKYLTIPKYFNNRLLSKIELFISEIELDRKNYESAFVHVLKAFYIIISLKLNRRHIKFNSEQKTIQKYIELISKLKEKESGRQSISRQSISNIPNLPSLLNNNDDFQDDNLNQEDNDKILNKYKMNININSNNNIENKYDKFENKYNILTLELKQDNKTRKELEKFFIFLNKLSLYQIKILNETQPENSKSNDLPILFSSQFKDCLSYIQRNELDNLHTLALSRCMILKNTNKWIMPNNLKIGNIKGTEIKKYIKRKTLKFINKFCKISENNNISIRQTKEFKYFQEILKSKNCTKELKNFVNKNFNYVIKILRKADENDIKDIINSPNIIIKPIRKYKKKEKEKKYSYSKEKEYRFNSINNYDFDNNLDIKRFNSIDGLRKSVNISFFKNNLNINGKNQRNSMLGIFNLRNSIQLFNKNNSLHSCDYIKKRKKRKGDYNDGYQDFEISVGENSEGNE